MSSSSSSVSQSGTNSPDYESGSESATAHSSSNRSSVSSSTASVRDKAPKEHSNAIAVESMKRQQQLRRLLSQRKIGDVKTIHDGKDVEPFVFRRGMLDADDSTVFSTFSNALLFSRLCATLSTTDGHSRSQNFDDVLAAANPMFYYSFKFPLDGTVTPSSREAASHPRWKQAVVHRECAELDHSDIVVNRRKRQRSTVEASTTSGKKNGTVDVSGTVRVISDSSSIIKKSLHNWEQHLAEVLKEEGVSVQNFRRQRNDSNYIERKQFLEKSQWADYQREMELEAKQREQKMKRAIRRGETEMS
ncbi:hypothetical protein ERJ75_000756600 [Trypanosoma vivax]|uniref:BCNT-C domain-containing protein n=1 Tax=Trypanosoma vivax (strain Y486) TaxID=1055687 RepID=G0U003_TRYVY|nr:hypothetical protein TRVL_01129 [Trypanosoma vivax]KAH8613558.1 hypothetical protein ERJ75_000756600 [Trypanosoma vivax]CCC49399.1 conserved hypothetical protein [Trypanosoma vivax Y486]